MEKIDKKDKKLILVNRENFKTSITNILRNSNTNYLILLQFKNNLEENLSMLEELKRYFLNKKRYEYLKNTKSALLFAIITSWGIAFFEYCFSIPANRIGAQYFTVAQLKIIQEVITLIVFSGFSILYLKQEFRLNYIYAFLCMIGAVYFMFKK